MQLCRSLLSCDKGPCHDSAAMDPRYRYLARAGYRHGILRLATRTARSGNTGAGCSRATREPTGAWSNRERDSLGRLRYFGDAARSDDFRAHALAAAAASRGIDARAA